MSYSGSPRLISSQKLGLRRNRGADSLTASGTHDAPVEFHFRSTAAATCGPTGTRTHVGPSARRSDRRDLDPVRPAGASRRHAVPALASAVVGLPRTTRAMDLAARLAQALAR